MREIELKTSEEYWDRFIRVSMATARNPKDEIKAEVMELIKLLKNEIPDYCVKHTPHGV